MLRFAEPCTKDGALSILVRGPVRFRLAGSKMSGFATARQKMVDGQVRTSDVTDIRIIEAMLALPRENFVPQSKRPLAYLDLDLDVAQAGSAQRFLVKPALTAKLLQAANLKETDNVLVVGAASGYAAALASRLAAKVIATEGDSALAATGREILAGLGIANVTFKPAEAAAGDPTGAPYDMILLNGATEVMPDLLCRQLKQEGRLLGVFAIDRPSRAMIVTHTHHDFGHRVLFDAAAPVLPGLQRVPAFVF